MARYFVCVCVVLSLVSLETWAQSKKAPGKSSRKIFTIGESDVAGKISQPQALYLIQKASVDLEFARPELDPLDAAWDTVYLDLFEP